MALGSCPGPRRRRGPLQLKTSSGGCVFWAGLEPDNVSAYAWKAVAETNGHPEAKKNKLNIVKKMALPAGGRDEKAGRAVAKKVDDNKKAAEH